MKARVIAHGAISTNDILAENNPLDKRYKRRILAEGDSWFSMGGYPKRENVLLEFSFPDRTIIVNIAEPGDTIVRMSDPKRAKLFQRYVAKKATAYEWHCILLSGGGNDLIDDASNILQIGTTAAACINKEALKARLDAIAQAFRTLAAIRDSAENENADCPIVVHTYDYPTPRDSPSLFFGAEAVGPWLHRTMTDKGINPDLWVGISERLIDALADALLGLAKGGKAIRNFSVIDTRNVLARADVGAKRTSGDWRNEIHPSNSGYRKIAAAMEHTVIGGG